MPKKIHSFFNNPWVAFPLMVILVVAFFWTALHFANDIESHQGPGIVVNFLNKIILDK